MNASITEYIDDNITNNKSCQERIFHLTKPGYNDIMDNNSFNRVLAARLKSARDDMRLSQAEVAECLGLNQSAYAHIETGRNALKIEHLVKLPQILYKPVSYFLGLPSNDLSDDEAELLHLYRSLSAMAQSDIIEFCRLLAARSR